MGRAGRKRSAGKREPSGKLSRSSADANVDPIRERMRRHGLSEKDARDQKAATFLGRLAMAGAISVEQYDAGAQYAKDAVAVAKAVQAPRGMGVPETGARASGDDLRYTAFVLQVMARHKAADDAIKALQERDGYRGKTISDALRYLVVQDLELPHMVPGLKLALDVLAGVYFTAQRRKAA